MRVLVVNAGSSSLKLRALDEDGTVIATRDLPPPRGAEDAGAIAEAFAGVPGIEAVGHRVVHGGAEFAAPVLIDGEVVERLTALVDLAPLHQPKTLTGIAAVGAAFPGIPEVACFDTAFHAAIPAAAATYALPREWNRRWGLRRYGFHGLSHAYASRRAAELLGRDTRDGHDAGSAHDPRDAGVPPDAHDPRDPHDPHDPHDGRGAGSAHDPRASGDPRSVHDPHDPRIVTCHLGAGASLAAVRGGRSVDTTMGFTPLEGLVMATRSGDVDAGLLLWLQERLGATAQEVSAALSHESGVLGLAGTADMREVVERAAAGDADAALALDVYVHRLRGHIARMAAALGGLDCLVFTGGVGENAPVVRRRAADGLGFLGVAVDAERNAAANDADTPAPDRDISAPGAAVRTFVIAAREDIEIARETREVVRGR